MKRTIKFWISVVAVLLFLAPVSFNIGSPSTAEEFTQIGSIALQMDINSAQAQIISSGECGIDVGSWASCISDGIFHVYEFFILYLTNIFLVIVGLMFDIILHFSIDSNFYRGGLMESGWSIMRDFTNIVFIFALLTIAFKLVVSQDDGKTKKSLVKTLLVALTINFSLFFSFLVIDASNLLAYTFFNRIEATGQYDVNTNEGTSSAMQQMVREVTDDQPSISLAIASKINPQSIIQTSGIDSNDLLLKFIIVTSAGILNLLLIYVFGSLLLLFLGRSLGLLVSGIVAPLAFASLTIPNSVNLPYIGFNTWIKQLISLAFMAPIFLFLMYLTITFLGDEGVLRGLAAAPSGGAIGKIMSVFIFFMIIGGFILLAKKITEKMAGELGGMVSKGVAGLTTGLVAGAAIVATGGAAAAGGAMRGAGSLIGRVTDEDSRWGRFGSGLRTGGQMAQAQNFNFAQSRIGKSMFKQAGIGGVGKKLSKAGNLSYSRADTAVRTGANKVRATISDLNTGRTPDSIQNWQDDIENSRQALQDRRNKNVEERAERDARNGAGATQREYYNEIRPDGSTVIRERPIGTFIDDLPNRIEELQAERNRRDATDIRNERDSIRNSTTTFNAEIQGERDEIRRLEQSRNTAPPGALAGITTDIATRRATIRGLEENIRHAERSTLDQRIEHLESQLQDRKHDARARMLNEDVETNWTTQDSTITINQDRRRERVQRRAARTNRSQPGNTTE